MANDASRTTSRLSGARILIIEDELIIGMELQDLLQQGGYNVMDLAPSNQQALAALSESRPDAVLLDCGLSDGQSTPVAQQLLAANIPFAVMSGHMESHLADECFATAPRLSKPFTSDAVLAMVRTLTTGRFTAAGDEIAPTA